MHDGMPYDPIQGQVQGHECLKATQEASTVSPARKYFLQFLGHRLYKNSSGDEIANVNFYTVRPEATRIR